MFWIACRALLFVALSLSLASCSGLRTRQEVAAGANSTTGGTSPSASSSATTGASSANAATTPPLVIRGVDYGKAPEKIAFGSCANQDQPQPIWTSILAQEPDLFVFMGDNIYASRPEQQPIGDQYKKLDRIPEYRKMREQVPFLAIWDDHDMGTNDGGADAPTKETAHKEFLNYFPYVRDSIPFAREGLYHAKLIGGQVTGRRRTRVTGPTVQVILLDTRSFRSPLKKAENPTGPLHKYDPVTDAKATLLGETQWEWLEEQLRKPANFRIIVSSIQLVATEHGFEKWANFPRERERFFSLLRKTGAKNLVILSGDRHIGTIAKTEVKGWGPLYDITASSINRPSTLQETDKEYLGAAFGPENFGLATFDWARKNVRFELRDITGKVVNAVDLKIR